MRFLAFLALFAATIVPAAAQTATGMDAMKYYVGNWTCAAIGEPDSNSTATYTIGNGILRDTVIVPAQGKLTTTYELAITTAFDAKNSHYVQTSVDNQPTWSVSFAKPFTGNTEEWLNQNTNDGKLGRTQVVRTNANSFDIIGYSTTTQTKPDYKVTCNRAK